MHIERSVVGRLRPAGALDALRATFPAGTLSGAPKVRAMEIIDELEPTERGPYGGAVGYLGWDGTWTPASPSARSSAATASPTSRRAPASWPTRCPRPSTRRRQNKAAALFRAIEVAAGQEDW